MLTKEDLTATPVHKKLNKWQNDLTTTIRFLDEGHFDHEKRIVQLEIQCTR